MTSQNNPPVFIFETPRAAWEAIYADCQNAQKSIICEHYILANDAIGQRFIDLFIDKAKSGVEIILILDGIGSRHLISSERITALRQAGGIVHFYKPLTLRLLLRPWQWLPRNHNKIILIDHDIGHIGSACFQQKMQDWRDIHIRFSGTLAQSLYIKIKRVNAYLSNKKPQDLPSIDPAPDEIVNGISYAISQPHLKRNLIYKTLLQQIRQAQYHVLLVTPYFLPPYRLRKALLYAARRGIKVTLMLSEKTDVAITDCVSRSYLPLLLRHNIQVIFYQKNILHAKYVVIDNTYAMVGSTNLDYLSLLQNHETNLIIYNQDIIKELTTQFEKDALFCKQADWNYYYTLPRLYRLGGYIGRIARKVM